MIGVIIRLIACVLLSVLFYKLGYNNACDDLFDYIRSDKYEKK